jgi:hypothetical protein
MSSHDPGSNEDPWLEDLTPEEREWLAHPGDEPRGYQPKQTPDEPSVPPPPPSSRASASPAPGETGKGDSA